MKQLSIASFAALSLSATQAAKITKQFNSSVSDAKLAQTPDKPMSYANIMESVKSLEKAYEYHKTEEKLLIHASQLAWLGQLAQVAGPEARGEVLHSQPVERDAAEALPRPLQLCVRCGVRPHGTRTQHVRAQAHSGLPLLCSVYLRF